MAVTIADTDAKIAHDDVNDAPLPKAYLTFPISNVDLNVGNHVNIECTA